MDYWEFLLQKEGDHSWLPLESPDVEILEGRYRVVARTSRVQASVEIRITHLSTEEIPPKRRVQTRFHKTNQDGLMVIFPFTRLKPGIWEVRCIGGLMEDLMGEGWHYTVRLQVVAKDLETAGDWQPDWQIPTEATREEPIPTPTAPPVHKESIPAPAVSPTQVERIDSAPTEEAEELVSQVEPVSVPIGHSITESDFSSFDPAGEPTEFDSQVLQITLEQDNFIARWGESFSFAGHIHLPENEQTPDPQLLQQSWPVELQVCLRDPQSLQVWVNVCQTLTVKAASTPFTCTVNIPIECQTRLLLGEVSIYSIASEAEPTLTPLATQSFSITADLTELLGALTKLEETNAEALIGENLLELPDEDTTQLEQSESTAEPSLNLAFLKLVEAPKTEQLNFRPSTHQPLPPQIYRPDPEKAPLKAPKLPILPRLPNLVNPTSAEQDQPIESELPPEPTPSPEASAAEETELQTPTEEALVEPSAADSEPAMAPEDLVAEETVPPAEAETLLNSSDSELTPEPEQTIPEDAFQSLKLQHRFWTRLNALASDAELTELLKIEVQSTLPSEAAASSTSTASEVGAAEAESPDTTNTLLVEESGIEPTVTEIAPEVTDLEQTEDSEAILLSLETDLTQVELALAVTDEEVTQETAATKGPSHLLEDVADLYLNEAEDDWVAREIVVDDEPLEPETQPTQSEIESTAPTLLSEDEPVPVPELEVPTGELVSGEMVTVRIRIPPLPPRMHVKLWINDRQTRSLMDGPRWLTVFSPNGLGSLETAIQLAVPFGSLEIQFEAIAVEVQSQRESHKTTINRMVIPPNLPTLSLSELDELNDLT